MLRIPTIAFLGLLVGSHTAAAEADPIAGRWDQPAGTVAAEDDPAAPFVSFFTPIYQDEAGVAAWSMIAAKWRDGGQVDLSVGVRLAHPDDAPWDIVAARLADGSKLAIDSFAPYRSCGEDGACMQRETATITLSPQALENAATEGMSITLITASGGDRRIAFPPEILSQLYRHAMAR